jgi:uncharacterized membrane protein
VAVGAVIALGVAVRFVAASHLWLDEALSVNIAALPLGEIPEALRRDGAPPLYYLLLHGWTSLWGTGELAVRSLSGLFSVAALPLVWLAGRRLAGRRMAWTAVVLLAANPFAARYATEARMYSLLVVLVLAGHLALDRVLEGRGGRSAHMVLGLATGLALLTHYWSFYLVAVVASALAVRARRGRGDERRTALRALRSMALGGLLFLPWLPSFLYQLAHTGTPWGRPGTLRAPFDTITHFAGGYWDPGIVLGLLFFGLILLGVFGRAVTGRQIVLDLRPHPPGRRLAVAAFGTLVVAVVAGQVGDSAFAVRYASVVFPFVLLLVALGVEAFADRRVHAGIVTVAVVLGLWATAPNVFGERTSAARVAAVLAEQGEPGDVVAYCPDQLGPSVSRLLPDGLVQLTFPRATPPQFVDWSDYERVNRAASTADFARTLVDLAGPERDIWVVWAPGYRTFGTKCQNLVDQLDDLRPDMTRLVTISTRYFERPGLVVFRPS